MTVLHGEDVEFYTQRRAPPLGDMFNQLENPCWLGPLACRFTSYVTLQDVK